MKKKKKKKRNEKQTIQTKSGIENLIHRNKIFPSRVSGLVMFLLTSRGSWCPVDGVRKGWKAAKRKT